MSEPGGTPYIPLNLQKKERYEIVKDLKVGDRYTFITPTPILYEPPDSETETRELIVGDSFSRWYSTAESGRVFKIHYIERHADDIAYVCTFEGFAVAYEERGMIRFQLQDVDQQIAAE